MSDGPAQRNLSEKRAGHGGENREEGRERAQSVDACVLQRVREMLRFSENYCISEEIQKNLWTYQLNIQEASSEILLIGSSKGSKMGLKLQYAT